LAGILVSEKRARNKSKVVLSWKSLNDKGLWLKVGNFQGRANPVSEKRAEGQGAAFWKSGVFIFKNLSVF
jgi:hypothetical protein